MNNVAQRIILRAHFKALGHLLLTLSQKENFEESLPASKELVIKIHEVLEQFFKEAFKAKD